MPTDAEINSIYNTWTWELADGVTWTWISDTATYGTVGFEVYVTSDSSKKIFLPAAGYWNDALYDAGSSGGYWSSEYYDGDYAYDLLLFSNGGQDWNYDYRYFGLSVRPVHN